MRVRLSADGRASVGGAPLILHSERLADPLDSFTRAISTLTGKRKKTEADHQEIGRLEFFGGLYTDEPLQADIDGKGKISLNVNGQVPVIPAWNMLRCLQDGAKRQKRGVDVLRGVFPLPEMQFATIEYDGPDSLQSLWEEGGWALRKTVGVGQKRTMRTRPIFAEWKAIIEFEVDPVIFDMHTLTAAWKDAGRYAGIGDMRPVYGRFNGEATEVNS